MTWDLVVQILGFVVGGGIFAALAQVLRAERVDRVSELARHQQEALEGARDAEVRLRGLLADQKSQVFDLEMRWQARFAALEERYERKCAELEADYQAQIAELSAELVRFRASAREREEDYQGQVAELSAELVRLKTLMLRCGIDPERGVQIPGTGELRSPAIKY